MVRGGGLLAGVVALWLALLAFQAFGAPFDGFVPTHAQRPGAGIALGPAIHGVLAPPRLAMLYALCLATVSCAMVWVIRALRGHPPLAASAVAVAFLAATAIFNLPYLSNDVYLYLVHGEMLAALDVNPYVAAPAQHFPREVLRGVPWTEQTAPYGPAALLMFRAARVLSAGFVSNFWILKTLIALPWIALLSWLAASGGLRAPERAFALVWLGLNPLLLLEIGQNAHLEGWTGALLLLALLSLGRPTVAWTAISGALWGLAAAFNLSMLVVGGALVAGVLGKRRVLLAGVLLAAALAMLAAAYFPLWAAWDTFSGVRTESMKSIRSVHALLRHYAGATPEAVQGLGLAGFTLALVAGGFVAARRRMADGVLAALALHAVIGRTFFQPWHLGPLLFVALVPRLARAAGSEDLKTPAEPLNTGEVALLVASASALVGGYGVLIAAGNRAPAAQAVSLAVALLPPAAAWILLTVRQNPRR